MGGSLLVEHPDFMFKYSPKNRSHDNRDNRDNGDNRDNRDNVVGEKEVEKEA